MGLNWLITGGCGFIGRNLIKNLMDEGGHYVRVVDNLSVGTKKDLSDVCSFNEILSSDTSSEPCADKVDLIVADILDAQSAVELSKQIDVIVHLAANTGVGPSVENPRKDCEMNVIGTFNYLEAARLNSVDRFIFASSGAPAGECEPPIHEELPPHPVSPYGASKLAGEGYCSAYFRTFKIDTIALRFSNVYGPLSTKKNSVVAKFIKRIIDNKSLEIYGDGHQTRDFIFIDDLIKAIRLAVQAPNAGGEIFQIATAHETTVSEMTEILIETFKSFGYTKKIQVNYTDSRLGDVKRNFSDTSKALNSLGWQTDVDLKDGLQKTIKWFFTNK